MFVYLNTNPSSKSTGDCVVRAISVLENQHWRKTMLELTAFSYFMYELVDDNDVWSMYMRFLGYERFELPDTCPDCYTLRKFCALHPYGKYLVCTGSHVIAVIDGDYYDTWNSGNETVSYYFRKGM